MSSGGWWKQKMGCDTRQEGESYVISKYQMIQYLHTVW
jgi:hypothetical protein